MGCESSKRGQGCLASLEIHGAGVWAIDWMQQEDGNWLGAVAGMCEPSLCHLPRRMSVRCLCKAAAHAAPRQVLRASPSQPVVGHRQRRAAASALLRKHSRRRGAGALRDLLMRGCGVKGWGGLEHTWSIYSVLLAVTCRWNAEQLFRYTAAGGCPAAAAVLPACCPARSTTSYSACRAVNNRRFRARATSSLRARASQEMRELGC